jgi:hypothetical protein
MEWIPQLRAWFEDVLNVVSATATIAGAITLVGAIVGFVLRRLFVDPFGPKAPAPPRYRKYFQSLAKRIRRRTKALVPQALICGDNYCSFTTMTSTVEYVAHFQDGGKFRVYLNMYGADAATLFQQLRRQEGDLQRRFKEQLLWEQGNSEHRIVVYYPEVAKIGEDAKKLRQVRKWAMRRLVDLQKLFDQRVHTIRTGQDASPQSKAPEPLSASGSARSAR